MAGKLWYVLINADKKKKSPSFYQRGSCWNWREEISKLKSTLHSIQPGLHLSAHAAGFHCVELSPVFNFNLTWHLWSPCSTTLWGVPLSLTHVLHGPLCYSKSSALIFPLLMVFYSCYKNNCFHVWIKTVSKLTEIREDSSIRNPSKFSWYSEEAFLTGR